jgi:LuxR family maltose regulon positive regulatory protein
MVAVTRGEVARSRELARQALDDLPLDSPWRSAVTFCLGTTHFESGDMAAAAHVLSEALRLSQAEGAHYIQYAAASFLADIQVFQGHLGRAMELYQQVLAWADHGLPQKGSVMAQAGQAYILCERNQLDAALAHVQLGTDQVDLVGGAWSAHVLYRVLARLQRAQGNWTDALDTLERAYQMGQSGQVSLVVTQAAALRAGLQLAQGDLEAATAWAENSGLSPDDPEVGHPGWREVAYLALARVLDAQGRHAEALALLDRLMGSAQAEARHGSAISILVLLALVQQARGNRSRALECLERALALAEPEGYIRVFVDEGEPMRSLLADFQSMIRKRLHAGADEASPRLMAYAYKLLAVFSGPDPAVTPNSESPPDSLNQREMEVLRLIHAGLTNQEIADQIVIAVSTVKWHINHLYAKLGVHTRTQVLARAKELGLL